MGRVLLKSGHQLVFLTNPYHEKLIGHEGFEFHPIGTVEDYNIAIAPPVITGNKLKDKGEGIKVIKRLLNYMYLKPSKDIYEIVKRLKTHDTLITNHFCVYGAKMAAEKLSIKNVNINLSPHWLSNFKATDGFSALIGRKTAKVITNFFDNQFLRKPINTIRGELGLQPLKKSSDEWMFEGMNLCLFPDWLLQFKLSNDVSADFVGFPESLKAEEKLPHNVMRFFKTHEKTILFTPGTAFQDNRNKCCAIVYHGGIGTCYEALKAGIPQLICYRMDEQKTNSHAIKALGVSNELPFKSVNSSSLFDGLQIIHDTDVLSKCNKISEKLNKDCPERNLLNLMKKF